MRAHESDVGEACGRSFTESLSAARFSAAPFPHFELTDALPPQVIADLAALDIPAPALGGVSGSREVNNSTRSYLDPERIAGSEVCAVAARAFQSPRTVAQIEARLGVQLSGCHLRIEYALDTDGFWLAPHTDLGVKRFTLLCYLGPDGRFDLGTDLYDDDRNWAKRPAFAPGMAVAFAPSDRSWHGFEPRSIGVVRKSLIVNYVTQEWRAREQLAFPDRPVAAGEMLDVDGALSRVPGVMIP